jgi:hypothetical protein
MDHKLIHEADGTEVKPGSLMYDFREDVWEFVRITQPAAHGSSGLVLARRVGENFEQEFYPSVFDLKIVPRPLSLDISDRWYPRR